MIARHTAFGIVQHFTIRSPFKKYLLDLVIDGKILKKGFYQDVKLMLRGRRSSADLIEIMSANGGFHKSVHYAVHLTGPAIAQKCSVEW